MDDFDAYDNVDGVDDGQQVGNVDDVFDTPHINQDNGAAQPYVRLFERIRS